MPQLDKEIFTGYFFLIFFALISMFSDTFVSENFLRINGYHFLHNQLINSRKNLRYEYEKFLFYVERLIEKRLRAFR